MIATEHTYRPARKSLLESLAKEIIATNEAKRIACGAPDFIITRKNVPLGHVETKDVGARLKEMGKREEAGWRTAVEKLLPAKFVKIKSR